MYNYCLKLGFDLLETEMINNIHNELETYKILNWRDFESGK